MKIFRSVSPLIFAVVISGQQDPAGLQKEPRPWLVEGEVTSDAGPVQGATIRSSGPEPIGTSTDARGHYRLKGLLAGNYSIHPQKDGFGDPKPRLISVLPGLQVDRVDFQLTKGAVISGRVLDAEKNPLPGVSVAALVAEFHDGKRVLVGRGQASTDDLGEYRILDLEEGQFFVSVVPEPLDSHKRLPAVKGEQPQRNPRQGLVRKTFYPNAQSLAGASPLYLHWGEQREAIDVVLDRVGTFCISGTVVPTAANGPSPRPFLFVKEAIPEWGVSVASGEVKPGEEFEICGLPPGPYRILADTTAEVNSATFKITGYVEMEFAVSKGDVELGKLYPMPPVPLAGKVSIEGARPEDPVPDGLVVSLDRQDRPNFAGEKLSQRVRASGEFGLDNVIVADYRLRLPGLPKGYYIREASQQGHDVLHDLVRPGRGDLRILLGADGPAIAGNTVDKDNQPVHDATVILASRDGPPILLSQQSDQDGRFQFDSGLPPGDYKLAALTGLLEAEAQDPEFVRTNLADATEVTLAAKGSQSVTLGVRKVR